MKESVGLFFAFLLFLVFLAQARATAKLEAIERRLDALRRRLDAIADHLGLATDEPAPEGVADLLREGRKIEAIKAYRRATGAGLAEAKAAVERIAGEA